MKEIAIYTETELNRLIEEKVLELLRGKSLMSLGQLKKEPEYLNVEETLDFLKISRSTLRRIVIAGTLNVYGQSERKQMFSVQELNDYLRN